VPWLQKPAAKMGTEKIIAEKISGELPIKESDRRLLE